MSGTLHVHFNLDMPGATVELVAPNLETVDRVWLNPGGSTKVEVPSEATFVRVHLPSGQVVTLHDPGNLDRKISLANLVEKTQRRTNMNVFPKSHLKLADLQSFHQQRAQAKSTLGPGPAGGGETTTLQLIDGTDVKLTPTTGTPQAGTMTLDGREVRFHPPMSTDAYDLSVATPDEQLSVRLPGRLEELYVRIDEVGDGLRILSVRVTTFNEMADSLGAYMARGDFYSAASMTSWADTAEAMLHDKVTDPCAAAVGAYLLLRLRRFDLMRSWAQNLADWWPNLVDGSVIWAWQQILQHGDEGQVRLHLGRAAAGPRPIFTEGLKLLGDGLRLLGTDPKAKDALNKLNEQAGIVLWDSPFTAGIHRKRSEAGSRVQFNVGYAPRA